MDTYISVTEVFFEVTVSRCTLKMEKIKNKKSKVVKDFEDSGVQIDYKVVGAKESRIIRVI